MKFKIKHIEVKEGNNTKGHWTSYIITGEDGTKASTFDDKARILKVGDTITANIEKKGQFNNLKEFSIDTPAELPDIEKQVRAISNNTRDRSVAISYAKDLVVAGKIELGQMTAYADKFLEYMNK